MPTPLCTHRENKLYEFYKKAVASFWTVEEVDLTQDYRDWAKLTGALGGGDGERPRQRAVCHAIGGLLASATCTLLPAAHP